MNASVTTTGTTPGSAPRTGALDGLRGVAAILVVTFHLSVNLGAWPYPTAGYLGVIVFFTLSGYLIGGQCWDLGTPWSGYARFVRRRLTRLMPAILGLCVVGGLALPVFGGQAPVDAARSASFALTQTMAFGWLTSTATHPAWTPTWSLTVEWAFYVTAPFLIILARRLGVDTGSARRAAWLSAGALFGVGLTLSPRAFFMLPIANVGAMWAGTALALEHRVTSERRVDPSWAGFGLALILVGMVLPGSSLGWGYRWVEFPATVAAALLVIDGIRHRAPATGLLTRLGLPAVGVRAYSLYLWHLPVMWIVWFNHQTWPPLATTALVLVALPVVAGLSFHYLERPWLRRGRTVERATPEPAT